MVRDVARRVVRGNKLVATHAPNFNLDNLPLGLGQRDSNNVEDRESILRALGRLGLAPSQPSFTPLGGRRRLPNTTAGGGGVTTLTEACAGDQTRKRSGQMRTRLGAYVENAWSRSSRNQYDWGDCVERDLFRSSLLGLWFAWLSYRGPKIKARAAASLPRRPPIWCHSAEIR